MEHTSDVDSLLFSVCGTHKPPETDFHIVSASVEVFPIIFCGCAHMHAYPKYLSSIMLMVTTYRVLQTNVALEYGQQPSV